VVRMPHLIVIYGAPLSGKTSLARALAWTMPGKTARVGIDAMYHDSIAVPDEDAVAELEMVHTQARLLVANYLKHGYHTIVEGSFYYERDGELHRYEHDIDQLVALMRNLAQGPLIVRLAASEELLRRRAGETGREDEVDAALRIESAYRPRYGERSLTLKAEEMDLQALVEAIRGRLE
jgi:tRNA uridine 5-carbamoylmethylation protein Kti12